MATHSRYNYTPKRILSLTDKDFTTGISTHAHSNGSGLFFTATGVNSFVEPYAGSTGMGLLQTYNTPTDLTASVVLDIPTAGVENITGATAGSLYILGDAGHFYEVDLSNDTITDRRSASPITNPALGMDMFKPKGGTKYLYYWQQTRIGRWDLTAGTGGFTDNWDSTGIQTTIFHQSHLFAGAVYYGNLDRIGKVYDVAGTATNSADVLDFPNDYVNTCLEDDGTYLIIGINKNVNGTTGSTSLDSSIKILFWDTFSSSWSKEWLIPDFGLSAIKRYTDGFIAFCGRGIYYFDFNTKPKKLRMTSVYPVRYGYPNAVDALNDALIFANSTNSSLATYGKLVPTAPVAYLQPWAGLTGDPTFINTSKVGRIYVGTAQPKFYYYVTGVGTAATGVSAQTVYFDFGDVFQIDRIDLIFGAPLASGDDISVSTRTDEVTGSVTWGSATFAADGAVLRKELKGHIKTDQMSLVWTWNAGAVKIKRIDVYGERVSTI